jgi:hypothetical protein
MEQLVGGVRQTEIGVLVAEVIWRVDTTEETVNHGVSSISAWIRSSSGT